MTTREAKTQDAIVDAVIEAWEALDEEFLWSLIKSIPQRVQAVIKTMMIILDIKRLEMFS